MSNAKYKKKFQIKYMEAILSHITRKLLWFEISKMLVSLKNEFIVSFTIIFSTLSFPIKELKANRKIMKYQATKTYAALAWHTITTSKVCVELCTQCQCHSCLLLAGSFCVCGS